MDEPERDAILRRSADLLAAADQALEAAEKTCQEREAAGLADWR